MGDNGRRGSRDATPGPGRGRKLSSHRRGRGRRGRCRALATGHGDSTTTLQRSEPLEAAHTSWHRALGWLRAGMGARPLLMAKGAPTEGSVGSREGSGGCCPAPRFPGLRPDRPARSQAQQGQPGGSRARRLLLWPPWAGSQSTDLAAPTPHLAQGRHLGHVLLGSRQGFWSTRLDCGQVLGPLVPDGCGGLQGGVGCSKHVHGAGQAPRCSENPKTDH